MMHGREKSDLGIVAVKSANKFAQADAESMERRPGARRTRASRTSTGRRAGSVCPNDWIVYEREQKAIKQNGLRRCCTT